MKALVIAEHDGKNISSTTFSTVTAAYGLGEKSILVAGLNCEEAANEAAKISGIKNVLYADDIAYADNLAENIAPLIKFAASGCGAILAPATTTGKNFMPRVAALMDVAQISDICEIISEDVFVRPIYAGTVLAKIKSKDPVKVITVRTTSFEASPKGDSDVPIEKVSFVPPKQDDSVFVKLEKPESNRPDLLTARVIVSGGRGLKDKEGFKLLEQLADKLGAAIGASRAAVDAGFISNDCQVGQTGKIVAPELYFALGISGAVQHLAGMKESKVIVAINKDEEAPIFEVADYGLVADIFKVLPELMDSI